MRRRPKLNLFLKIFYQSLKALTLVAIRVFYGKVVIKNKERLTIEQPCILVSNHPSTMMDPLNVASRVNRYVHFLANSSLFQSKFTYWFFNTFYCIPVTRKKDKPIENVQNEDSFSRAYDFLSQGGSLYIAAEGVSTQEHDLKPLKTGTARIGLGTEKKNQYGLDLIILPVGIYYQDAQRFRSPQLLNVGEPIHVSHYKEQDEVNHREAVEILTTDLEDRLRSLVISVGDKEQDELFRMLEAIMIQDENSIEESFSKSQKLASWVSKSQGSPLYESGESLLDYLKKEQVSIDQLGKPIPWSWQGIVSALIAPLGFIFNFLPIILISLIHKKMALYDGYTSSVKIMAGLILFPICYGLNVWVLNHWFSIGWFWPIAWILFGWSGLKYSETLSRVKRLWGIERFRGMMVKDENARAAMAQFIHLKGHLKSLL